MLQNLTSDMTNKVRYTNMTQSIIKNIADSQTSISSIRQTYIPPAKNNVGVINNQMFSLFERS